MLKILFLCTGNSRRSQMAEGWAKHFPGKTKVIHHGFDDPLKLADNVESTEEKLNCYRRVRDEIKSFMEQLPDILKIGNEL